jgi:hypothetical protein
MTCEKFFLWLLILLAVTVFGYAIYDNERAQAEPYQCIHEGVLQDILPERGYVLLVLDNGVLNVSVRDLSRDITIGRTIRYYHKPRHPGLYFITQDMTLPMTIEGRSEP